MRTTRFRAGYSLLELLIVIGVLALLAALAGQVVTTGDRAMANVKQRVESLLAESQLRAAREGRVIVISALANGSALLADGAVVEDNARFAVVTPILFDADGLSSGGRITIDLRGERATVDVEVMTGRLVGAPEP